MERWWDKETAQLSALPDLQSEREIPKQGNQGDCLNMSGVQRKFAVFDGGNKNILDVPPHL